MESSVPYHLHPKPASLWAFAQGAGSLAERKDIEEHLQSCPQCRRQLETALKGLLPASPVPSPNIDARLGATPPTVVGNVVTDRPTQPLTATGIAASERAPASVVPGYEILHKLGHGGVGVVYKARQIAVNRFVALKLHALGGDASLPDLTRFRTEAEILARLKHENIVQIYDAGIHEGRPYLAMELMEGGSLAEALANHRPSPVQTARCLFKMACAVQAAHERGIIHRDLKPGNILLPVPGQGSADRWEHPKISDFGFAKLLGNSPGLTLTGAIVGTPGYMAPEQAMGKNEEVGPAADIYALGTILYTMLIGQPPFVGPTSLAVLQKVQTVDPTPPIWIRRNVPKDLSIICMKCLEKAPARRYATAAELAEDLDRFLHGLQIRARRAGAAERLLRWCRRNPAPATILGLVVVMLLAALAAAAGLRRLATEREVARVDALRAASRARWQQYCSNLAEAGLALQLNRPEAAKAALLMAPAEFRGWEYRHFSGQLDMASLVLPDDGPTGCVVFSPDGHSVAAQAWASKVRIWDTATGRQRMVLTMPGENVCRIALDPEGRHLATSTDTGRVRIWDLVSGHATMAAIPWRDGLRWTPFFTADGKNIVAHEGGLTDIYVLEAISGRAVAHVRLSSAPTGVASAGQRLIVTQRDRLLRIFDRASGSELANWTAMHADSNLAFALSPDGRRLAYGTTYPDSAIYLWDLDARRCIARMTGHQNTIWNLAFSPDGHRLASASQDQMVRLWDGGTGALVATLKGHSRPVMELTFNRDGRYLATGSIDQTVLLWDGSTGEFLLALRGHNGQIGGLAFNRDGLLASSSADKTVRLWEPEQTLRLTSLRGHGSYVYDVAFHPDGRYIASAAWDGTIRLWDLDSGRQTGCLRHAVDIVSGVSWDPRGERLVGTVRKDTQHSGGVVWAVASGQCVGRLDAQTGNSSIDTSYIFSPRGDVIAGGGCDGAVRLWSTKTFEQLATLSAPQGPDREIGYLAFRPDGMQLAAGRADGSISLWSIADRRLSAELRGHRGIVHRVIYNHDGRLLASAGDDNTVRLWDMASQTLVSTLQHGCPVYGVAFHPDGSRLASACADNTIRLWDLVHKEEVAKLSGHTGYVHALTFSPDGTRLVSASGDYTLRVWDTLSPTERARNTPAASAGLLHVRENLIFRPLEHSGNRGIDRND
jgi:WD40 repeat protein